MSKSRPAGVVLLKTTHNFAQQRTTTHNYTHNMVDFIVLSIQLVFMVLGVSYSRVLYIMILYFKHIIHIDDFPLNGHPPSSSAHVAISQ